MALRSGRIYDGSSINDGQPCGAERSKVSIVERLGPLDRMVTSVTDDSRSVSSGSLFVAVKGERVDGHRYVGQAIKAGAAAIVGQDLR